MAKRIATEYVKAVFKLTSSELTSFISLMEEQQLRLQVLVLENGNQSLVLEDVVGKEELRMTFERHYDQYVCELSCRIVQHKLTNAMRKAVSAFRGNAIVNRIYSHFTMIYHYKDGAVQLIIEQNAQGKHIVFEKRNTAQLLQSIYESRQVEREINRVNGAINELLDLRNQATTQSEFQNIDDRLQELAFKLFTLEA